MARKRKSDSGKEVERLVYCSGPHMEGDGSKESSTCPSNHSQITTAVRYQCSNCTMRLTPKNTLQFGPDGKLTDESKARMTEEEKNRKEAMGIDTKGEKRENLPALALHEAIDPETTDGDDEAPPVTEVKHVGKPKRAGKIRKRRMPRTAR